MTLNLVKGQVITGIGNCFCESNEVSISIGWKMQPKSFSDKVIDYFLGDSNDFVNVETSAILLQDGGIRVEDVISYDNLHHYSGSVMHSGSKEIQEEEYKCERLSIDLKKVPNRYDEIVLIATITDYAFKHSEQKIEDVFVRLSTGYGDDLRCNVLNNEYPNKAVVSIILGKLYKSEDKWNFEATCSTVGDSNIISIAKRVTKEREYRKSYDMAS